MDKYLKQLLESYAKVILPSFGAIVVENEETGNLMFNTYLSYNDGKLDDLIVGESNMELQEAQNMVAKYIRDIQVQIDKGESYDIFGLGRFYKNSDGEVEFEGNLKDGPKSKSKKDSTKLATTTNTEIDKKKDETSKPKKVENESKPEAKKEKTEDTKVSAKSETKKVNKTEKKSDEKENKYVANKGSEEVDSKKEIPKKEVKKKDKPVKKDKPPKPAKTKKEKKPKDGKKKRFGAFFWVAIIILALASAGLIYIGLNYEKVKSYMGWDKFNEQENVDSKEKKVAADISADKKQQESIELDANVNNETDSTESSNMDVNEEGKSVEEGKKKEQKEKTKVEAKPSPTPQPVTSSASGTHHLIAGSFSNKSNADNLVEELKSKGLDARILGEFGGLHFVAAASYNSSKEARDDIQRVKQHASGAWIFKYNDK